MQKLGASLPSSRPPVNPFPCCSSSTKRVLEITSVDSNNAARAYHDHCPLSMNYITLHWHAVVVICTRHQHVVLFCKLLHNLIHSTSAVSITLCGNIELQGCITLMYWKWSMNFINLKKPQKIKELSLLWLIVPRKERKENLLLSLRQG